MSIITWRECVYSITSMWVIVGTGLPKVILLMLVSPSKEARESLRIRIRNVRGVGEARGKDLSLHCGHWGQLPLCGQLGNSECMYEYTT
ncbi:hypothetical protein LY78DRAFT_478231 [Colletotrichum sublineola]|nr:hypothetical protein LY78DRAFT_478231 [Colletotrichum sublineola]